MLLKALRYGLPALVTIFVLIQLAPYGRAHTNPQTTKEPRWDSPRTRELAAQTCFSCHSNLVAGSKRRERRTLEAQLQRMGSSPTWHRARDRTDRKRLDAPTAVQAATSRSSSLRCTKARANRWPGAYLCPEPSPHRSTQSAQSRLAKRPVLAASQPMLLD
jgi:hypothetical protein